MEWIVGILAVAALIWFVIRSRDRHHSIGGTSLGTFHMEGDGSFDFDVVGESQYQDALGAICGGKNEDGHEHPCTARLEREPHNRHDPNAIKVTISGRTVGYVARRDARAMSELMDRRNVGSFTADALIVGGWSRKSGDGHYGVKLDLPA